MLADQDSQRYQSWEWRTRGYHVSSHPVELEPHYTPLVLSPTHSSQSLDDGRRPGFWASLFTTSHLRATEVTPDPYAQDRADPLLEVPQLVELQLILPEDFVVRAGLATDLIQSLHNLAHPISFELIGLPQGIVVQLCCSTADQLPVLDNLRAYFPEVKVRQHPELLSSQWLYEPRYGTLIDFGLYNEFFRTLKVGPQLESDPLIGVVGAFESLEEDELGLLQVLFRRAVAPWPNDLWAFAAGNRDASELLPLIRAKIDQPLHACVIRVAALSRSPADSFERARSIGNAVLAATSTQDNCLLPLNNDGYPDEVHATDILRRQTHRTGMLLNTQELLALAHLPTATVRAKRLIRQSTRTKRAPSITERGTLLLGQNEHDGERKRVFLGLEQRLRHTYIIGASGTGKSTLLLKMILQDIEQGAGLAVLDPHGDLIEDVLARIPKERAEDVVLIDPADTDYPVGLNILAAHSDLERTVLSSDLVGVFRRLSTSWGDQMTAVFGNAILAFLESTRGGTLVDLRRFLVDPAFRHSFLPSVKDSEVVYFWQTEFPLLKGLPQAPILTRLDAFLRPKPIRYMISQKGPQLDFRRLMDGRKIVLAKLSQGAIGEENSYLLGSLLTAKIGQAAASRQEQDKQSRIPFFLYIDEFHNFITPSIASLLSGVRKYGVGLVLAHQDLRQVRSRSEDVASAVLSSPYTRIIFRVGDHDARVLAEGLSAFEAKDLQNLGIGRAIGRVERAEFDFNLEIEKPVPIEQSAGEDNRSAAVESSRRQYAARRDEVELETLSASSGGIPELAVGVPPTPPSVDEQGPVEKGAPARHSAPIPLPIQQRVEPSLPGRGGPQHKYLQSLLKRAAEDRGYRVSLEEPVLGGAGLIDVALERDGLAIACEISVTTPLEHELQNLSKCLAAGCDFVVLVSSDKKILAKARQAMLQELGADQDERLRFFTPQSFLSFLEEIEAKSNESNQTFKGYRVKVKYRALSEEDKRTREKLIADVISKSLKRSK